MCFGALIDLSFDSFVLVRFSDSRRCAQRHSAQNSHHCENWQIIFSFFSFWLCSLSSRKMFFLNSWTRNSRSSTVACLLCNVVNRDDCGVMWPEAFDDGRLGFICATEMWQEWEVRLENTNQLTLINKTFFLAIFFGLADSRSKCKIKLNV